MQRRKIIKIGTSFAVIIPPIYLEYINAEAGDTVDMEIDHNRITIYKTEKRVINEKEPSPKLGRPSAPPF